MILEKKISKKEKIMKKLVILVVVVLAAISLSAQSITNQIGTDGTFTVKDASNTFLTVKQSDGFVGIGTITPGNVFHVESSSANPLVYFKNTHTDGYGLHIRTTDNGNDKYALKVDTYNGEIEGLTVTNAGKVGIGTTNPSTTLDVKPSSGDAITWRDSNGDVMGTLGRDGSPDAGWLSLYQSDGTTSGIELKASGNSYFNGGNIGIGTTNPTYLLDLDKDAGTGTPTCDMLRMTNSTGTNTPEAYFRLEADSQHGLQLDGRSGSGNLSKNIQFWDLNSGEVGIGTTTPGAKLHIAGFGYGVAGGISMTPVNNTEFGHYISFLNTEETAIGSIARGSGENVLYNTTSDYRLKENVVNIDIYQAKSRLMSLRPVEYNYISDPNKTVISGFLAHEMADAGFANGVTGEKDAVDKDGKPIYQAIDTKFLIPEMVKMIQEQQTEIDALKKELNELKAQNIALSQKADAIDQLMVEVENLKKAIGNKDVQLTSNNIEISKLEKK